MIIGFIQLIDFGSRIVTISVSFPICFELSSCRPHTREPSVLYLSPMELMSDRQYSATSTGSFSESLCLHLLEPRVWECKLQGSDGGPGSLYLGKR